MIPKNQDKLGALHHFVPQGYLRRFAIKNKPHHVYAYEISKEPYAVNTKKVAAQRDLYTFRDSKSGSETAEIEDILAKVDDRGQQLLSLLDGLAPRVC